MKNSKKRIINIILSILGIIVFCVAIFKMCFIQVIIQGNSMEPTLHGNDIDGYDLGYMLRPSLSKIDRFDIVAVHIDQYEDWVKRIVGMPNETISYVDGKLYVNDILMEEPFTKIENPNLNLETLTLGENQYFVIGDNRLSSASAVINKKAIFGVGGFIYYSCGYIDSATGKCKDKCSTEIRGIK